MPVEVWIGSAVALVILLATWLMVRRRRLLHRLRGSHPDTQSASEKTAMDAGTVAGD
jgi:hypothetical protein